jgi:hypothetical protein
MDRRFSWLLVIAFLLAVSRAGLDRWFFEGEFLRCQGLFPAGACMTVFLEKVICKPKCSDEHYWMNLDHAESHSGLVG